jgi:hypothetical protein
LDSSIYACCGVVYRGLLVLVTCCGNGFTLNLYLVHGYRMRKSFKAVISQVILLFKCILTNSDLTDKRTSSDLSDARHRICGTDFVGLCDGRRRI